MSAHENGAGYGATPYTAWLERRVNDLERRVADLEALPKADVSGKVFVRRQAGCETREDAPGSLGEAGVGQDVVRDGREPLEAGEGQKSGRFESQTECAPQRVVSS